MNAIFSIHKKYSDLIFSGEKLFEFRNQKTKLNKGDTIYVYETKNGGCGMVVGCFTIGDIDVVPYHKVGTYWGLPYYVEKYGTDEEKRAVKRAMGLDIEGYDNSVVLNEIFDDECMLYMEKYNQPMPLEMKWNIDNRQKVKERDANLSRAMKLLDECDKWLEKIGFYNGGDTSTWRYFFLIEKPKRFEVPVAIQEYSLLNGKKLLKAPQSFCYVKCSILPQYQK